MVKLVKHDLRLKDREGDGEVDYIRSIGGDVCVVLGIACLAFDGGSNIALALSVELRRLLKSSFGHFSGSKVRVAVPYIKYRR
jgi:hypothetical protein